MKRKFYVIAGLYLFSYLTAFYSCTKNYEAGIIPECVISSIADTLRSRFYILSYHAEGRVASVYDSVKGGYKYLYFTDYVDIFDTNKTGPATPHFRFIIGSNGYASLKFVTNTSDADTVFYTYNTEGYLTTIERHKYSNNAPDYTRWYRTENTIANSNVISFLQYTFDAAGNKIPIHELQIEYYENKVNRQNSNILFYNSYANESTALFDPVTFRLDINSYVGLLGKPNKNLIKKLNLDNLPYFEYYYDYDKYDYATNMHQIGKSDTILNTNSNLYSITYFNCKD